MQRFTRYLPDSADWIKLKFEAYKYFLIGILAILGTIATFVFPSLRSWAADRFLVVITWLQAEHEIQGLYLAPAFIAFAYACYRLIRLCFSLHGPRYTRHFIQSQYDNIMWRWKWIGGNVSHGSLKPYCVACDTELHRTERVDQYSQASTRLFCTMCNKGFGIRGVSDLPDHARRKIESDARTGRWKAKQKHQIGSP